MVDLFEVKNFIDFYMKDYPNLKIEVNYNPYGMYMNFLIKTDKIGIDGCFACYSTVEAKEKINAIVIDFLAKHYKE